jgi:5-(carboxyamino)imidazole ribonucleotide mutase
MSSVSRFSSKSQVYERKGQYKFDNLNCLDSVLSIDMSASAVCSADVAVPVPVNRTYIRFGHANRFLSTGWPNDINWIVFSSPLIFKAVQNWVAGGVVETLVGVIMSSRSDWKTIQPANKTLASLGISHEVRIISPRKKPEKLRQYAESAAKRGIKILIACEGDSVNISDELVSATSLPVLGVVGQPNEPGTADSSFSSWNASAGTPVCALSHGEEGAKNAALLAANMLAEIYPSVRESTSRYLRRVDAASSSPGLSTAA